MPKAIAHLTSVHPRHDTRIFYKMCKSAAANGYHVKLIVADGQGSQDIDGIAVQDVGKPRGRMDRMWSAAQRVGRAAESLNADLYHLHDPELMPAGLKLKRFGKRVIFDAHEDLPKQILGKHYLSKTLRRILSTVLSRYESYACKRFEGVIAATPFIKDKFLPINPNTVDICNFPILLELSSATSWPDKQREVCYVGGLSRQRGITELVCALRMCRETVRLNLCGLFESAAYEVETKRLAGWSLVNAPGYIGRDDIRRVMMQSLAGLVTLHPLSNYMEALPVKMFEYMSAGLPVIASDFPLWRQIIEGNDCGLLVDPLNPAAIAQAINYVVTHPHEAQRMGRNGRRAVEERYNWGAEERKLISFYEEILEASAK
jgi:glycosyltransferase involved in cell wall biosynthesis